MDEIYRHHESFDFNHLPPIQPSSSHTVLFKVSDYFLVCINIRIIFFYIKSNLQLPLPSRGPPKAYPAQTADLWSQNCVRMPFSMQSQYPIDPVSTQG